MHLKLLKNEKGIGLVETIAALGISMIILTSLVSLSIYTLRSSLQSKLLLQGTKLANEELERIRAKRDSTTWSEFVTDLLSSNCHTSDGCYIDSSLNFIPGSETVGSGAEALQRVFVVSDPDGGSIDAATRVLRFSVKVDWMVGAEQKSAYIYSDLSNWRN
jgi:hypothetical protein